MAVVSAAIAKAAEISREDGADLTVVPATESTSARKLGIDFIQGLVPSSWNCAGHRGVVGNALRPWARSVVWSRQ